MILWSRSDANRRSGSKEFKLPFMNKTHSFARRRPLPRIAVIGGLILLVAPLAIRADEASDGQKAAGATIESWYRYVESRPDSSWEEVPADLKSGFTVQGWKMVTFKESEISNQHGKCLGRKLVSSTYNSPLIMRNGKKLDGEYVTVVYESSFADKESAFETFYFKKDSAGAWPLMGYLI